MPNHPYTAGQNKTRHETCGGRRWFCGTGGSCNAPASGIEFAEWRCEIAHTFWYKFASFLPLYFQVPPGMPDWKLRKFLRIHCVSCKGALCGELASFGARAHPLCCRVRSHSALWLCGGKLSCGNIAFPSFVGSVSWRFYRNPKGGSNNGISP